MTINEDFLAKHTTGNCMGRDGSVAMTVAEAKAFLAQPDHIILTPVVSSNIQAVGYDLASTTLAVQFSNGTVYRYIGVPKDIGETFKDAPSVGKALATCIRGKYLYFRADVNG